MRSVIHIGTTDKQGGAAIAAWRLHEGLLKLDVDSRVVSRHRTWAGPEVSTISTPLFEASDLFHQTRVIPAQPADATLFSLSPVSLPLLDHPWIAGADIIHLHWVAQFLAPEDIAGLCKAGKTVFWTFHDQWPYTGGCHYIGGTTREEGDWDGSAQIAPKLHALARLELLRKRNAFTGAPIHVIAPSRWIAEEAAASGLFREEQIHVIPYGIDPTVFHPLDHGMVPESNSQVNLLFGCQYLGERRKGYQELRQALLRCMSDPGFAQAVNDGKVCMTTFGGIPEAGLDLPIPATHLKTLSGEKEVADALRDASVFICPTLEDNLPNVILESLACGCPVIAFRTGGIPDLVSHEESGLLAPKGDIEALADCLIRFCLNGSLRQHLRDGTNHSSSKGHSLQTQASKILELYDAALQATGVAGSGMLAGCLPSVTVDAAILPHFGTEMTLMFLEEKATHQLNLSAQMEKLECATEQTWEYQQQVDQLRQLSQQQLEIETFTTNQQRLITERLKSKLIHAAIKTQDLTQRIKILKLQNRKLRTPPKRNSPLRRIRQYLIRRWKG